MPVQLSSTIWAAKWENQQSECSPSKDSDQPGHPPSLVRVFAVRTKKPWVLSYPLSAQQRLWSDWADAQADLSLRLAHTHFVGFFMSRLMYVLFQGFAKLEWISTKHRANVLSAWRATIRKNRAPESNVNHVNPIMCQKVPGRLNVNVCALEWNYFKIAVQNNEPPES